MIRVQVRPNETLETALKRFKRQCNYAGIFRLAKKYTYHEKRSDKRRREERERIRNIHRAMKKLQGGKGRARGMKRSKVKGGRSNDADSTETSSTDQASTKPGAVETKPTNPVLVQTETPKTTPQTPATPPAIEKGDVKAATRAGEPVVAKVDGDGSQAQA